MRRLGSLVLCLLLCTGCATIINGRYTNVKFASEPPGASVSTGALGKICETPCQYDLKNKDVHFIRVEHPDHPVHAQKLDNSFSGWFFVNLIAGSLGLGLMLIDFLVGAHMTIDQDEVFVDLREYEDEGEYDEEPETEPEPEPMPEEDIVVDEPGATLEPAPATTETPVTTPQPVAAPQLPTPPPSALQELRVNYPGERMRTVIRQYYGEVSASERRQIERRLYRILYHQQETQGATDLDQAVATEKYLREGQ